MTRSMDAMLQIYRRSSESVVTHQSSRSMRSMRAKLDDQRRSSETKKSDILAARRYATYELNWYDYNMSNMKDVGSSEGSAQDTKRTLSKSLVQSPTTSPMLQERISAPPNIKNSVATLDVKNLERERERESTYSNVSQQHPFLGGITITTVQVVEVDQNSRKKNNSDINPSFTHKINNNFYNSSYTKVIQDHEDSRAKIQKSSEREVVLNNTLKQNDRPRPRKQQRLSTQIVKTKRQSRLYDANNVNAHAYSKMVVLSSKRSSLGHFSPSPLKGPVPNKKVIRKKLRVLENSTTCNPTYSNDPTDMEDDLPILNNQKGRWLPTRQNEPKLLHASLVPLSQHVKRGSVAHVPLSQNAKRKSLVHASPRLNQPTRNNSKKKRLSVTVPQVKRASQIFRQQLLEQSILMSFNNQPPVSNTRKGKQIRKAKKGISAKLNHESRRERRRNLEKHQGQYTKRNRDSAPYNKNRQKVQAEPKAVNVLSIPRILDVEELVKKVDEELRKRENLVPPRPPPRRIIHGLPTPDSVPSTPQSKSNTSTLLTSLPDRRSAKSDEMTFTEPPPFPTHLTHKTDPFPARQSQNGSSRTPSSIVDSIN
ncbi:18075_t:CDS:1 [Dentiscutata erythropus]|uniref:18075_t:CDS:1 n=1 Tax=Dentiscutata erythropus TaxID=1348616 RepID=A0A9N9EPH6_9GLOM|nr:18075_t:CDS:1 [Dentiscutata erythropus]